RWRDVADGYLRARAGDLAGLARRVGEHLAGNGAVPPAIAVSAPGILIAADLSAAEAASLDPSQVFGVATATGGPTSHAAIEAGAEGVGLVRTELLFPGGPPPGEDEQEAAYRRIAERFAGRPVVLRTFYLGGDKPAAGEPVAPGEANPFLGLRGIRYALAQPELLRTQLAAFLRAGAGRPLEVMVPMVSTVEELRSVRNLLEGERERLAGLGVAVADRLELGARVEVPAAAPAAPPPAREADFLSTAPDDPAR